MASKSEGTGQARPKTVFVIGRIRRGHHIASIVHEVERLFAAEGLKVQTEMAWKKKQVRKVAKGAAKAGVDLVVAVGGDGTVLQVATSLAGTAVPLAIVPTGTGNLLAGNLEIPTSPEEAVRTALAGRPRRIDVGRVEIDGKRRIFTVACGVGFDADVMERTDSAGKARWGKLAYLASALMETGNIRNATHEITIDGVQSTMDAAQVLVANFGRLPSGLKARGVRCDDGLLDVFVVRASGPLPALLAGWEAIRTTGSGESQSGRVFRAKATTVRIETNPSRRVETDGSVVGRTPISLSVEPAALTVMVPRRKAGSGTEVGSKA
jgi:YegS/Rv2252/BmrU family lipid kinase